MLMPNEQLEVEQLEQLEVESMLERDLGVVLPDPPTDACFLKHAAVEDYSQQRSLSNCRNTPDRSTSREQ